MSWKLCRGLKPEVVERAELPLGPSRRSPPRPRGSVQASGIPAAAGAPPSSPPRHDPSIVSPTCDGKLKSVSVSRNFLSLQVEEIFLLLNMSSSDLGLQ